METNVISVEEMLDFVLKDCILIEWSGLVDPNGHKWTMIIWGNQSCRQFSSDSKKGCIIQAIKEEGWWNA